MSRDLAMSMDELERESAELLPSRETLCMTSNIGNTAQGGLVNVSALNGSLLNGSLTHVIGIGKVL
jgi:hypothetical protein